MTTKTAAQASIRPHTGAMRANILRLLMNAAERGMTCEEIEEATGYKHQTASARLHELRVDNSIRVLGQRKTKSGRQAMVHGLPEWGE